MHNHLLSFCFIQNRCQDWGKLIPFNIIMSAPLTWINLTHMYSIDIFYKSITLISLFFSLVTTREGWREFENSISTWETKILPITNLNSLYFFFCILSNQKDFKELKKKWKQNKQRSWKSSTKGKSFKNIKPGIGDKKEVHYSPIWGSGYFYSLYCKLKLTKNLSYIYKVWKSKKSK